MSECKRDRCEEEAACSYNNDYCSSTCEIMQLSRELKAKEEEYKNLELCFAEYLQSEHNETIERALKYIRGEMKEPKK